MSASRRGAERRGRGAEFLAAWLLRAKGYRILDTRCRTPVGEIDIVAVRRKRIAFVEVKLRADAGDAAFSVTPRQQARIARAAQHWLARRPVFQAYDIGLDVILLASRSWPAHIRDAFGV